MHTIREVKLSYVKEHPLSEVNKAKIRSSTESAKVLRSIWEDDLDMIERAYVLFLNNSNQVQSVSMISMGGLMGTVVDLRIIFAAALNCLATGIVLAHNHPSGSLNPSQSDIQLTKRVQEAGRVLDINLLDHIILTEDSYYSFADDGRL